jgi:hypothetical protein
MALTLRQESKHQSKANSCPQPVYEHVQYTGPTSGDERLVELVTCCVGHAGSHGHPGMARSGDLLAQTIDRAPDKQREDAVLSRVCALLDDPVHRAVGILRYARFGLS